MFFVHHHEQRSTLRVNLMLVEGFKVLIVFNDFSFAAIQRTVCVGGDDHVVHRFDLDNSICSALHFFHYLHEVLQVSIRRCVLSLLQSTRVNGMIASALGRSPMQVSNTTAKLCMFNG